MNVSTKQVAISNVLAIAAGGLHTCALRGSQLLCWGENLSGQLGDGTTTDRPLPVNAGCEAFSPSVGFPTSIAAGGFHTCATTHRGHVRCWGFNVAGQLGNGTTTDQPLPVFVRQIVLAPAPRTTNLSGIAAVSAGLDHTCALRADGQPFCGGLNSGGQLGDGTRTDRSLVFFGVPTFIADESP